jgi:aspartate/methionine/tyrosine aminotransferase
MNFGKRLVSWHSRRNREKPSARRDFWDPVTWKWKPGMLVGEMGEPLTIRDLLPKEPTPDGFFTPNGFSLDTELDWSGQPGATYWDLKDRIITNFKYNLEPENITFTRGVGGANYATTLATIDKGDKVIIPRPTWVQFEPLCYALRAQVKILPLKEELGWKWDLDELNEAVEQDTKLIYVTNPNNPTGRIYNEKEMTAICDIAKDVDATVVVDEEYRGLELDDKPASTPAVCDLYYNGVSHSGVSKIFTAAGLRVGWIATHNKDLLSRAARVSSMAAGGIGAIQMILAWAANEPSTFKKINEKNVSFGRASRAVLKEFMEKQDFFSCVIPQAGYLSFPGWTHDISSFEFSNRLFESKNVNVWPGWEHYSVEKHIRLGYGRVPTEQFKKDLELVGEFTKEL